MGKPLISALLVLALAAVWIVTGPPRPDASFADTLWGRWPVPIFLANVALSVVCGFGLRALWTGRLRRTLLEALLAVCSFALGLGLLELPALLGFHYGEVLRLPEHRQFTRIKPWNNPSNVRDEELIFLHKPGLHFEGETQGDLVALYGIATERRYPIDVRYDQRGFRNAQHLEQAGIVMLGDSFIEAGLVPVEQRVSEQLARALGQRVVNLGVSGYGPQQELVVLERYGLPLAPRQVLWFFFEGNDLGDIGRYERYLRAPHRYTQGDRFRERSLAMNALMLTSALTEPKRSVDTAAARSRSCRFTRSDGTQERLYFAYSGVALSDTDLAHLERVQAILERAAALASERSAQLRIVYAPTKFRVFEGQCEGDAGSLFAQWQTHDLPERMRRFAAARDIPFLDLTPALREAARTGRNPHFADDGHWDAAGHAIAARELAGWLEANAP